MDRNIKKSKRDIYLNDNIDDEVGLHITKRLKDLEKKESRDAINLHINSRWGMVQHLLAIYDTIQSLKCAVNTIASWYCMSAGAILLLAGTGKRKAYENTSIMIHELSSCIWYKKFTDINIENRFLEENNKKLRNIIAKHTGNDEEKIKEDIKRDLFLNTEQAKEYGIIDEIIE